MMMILKSKDSGSDALGRQFISRLIASVSMSFALLCCFTTTTMTPIVVVDAVLYGDEIYQDIPGGKFWAFYSEGIAIIDPESCDIETTITQDHNGDKLPTGWNDGVYMQSPSNDEGYVMIGSRVDETNELGDVVSHAYAVSTTGRKVVAKTEVGPRVVHSYGVYPQNEFWMHSDGNGLFYVIHLDDLSKSSHDDIEAKVDIPSHGKLQWDESPKLGDRGFATSTGEKFLFEIDLKKKIQTQAFNFTSYSGDSCRGLHAIAYSELNEHVYAECSGSGGAIEFDVSNDDIKFVHQFDKADGALYETPDGRYVVASSKEDDALYVFVPQGTGDTSSVEYTIPMAGRPSGVSFYTNGSDETIVCSPLTENLNQNQRRQDDDDDSTTITCGYYEGCTGAETSSDVKFGVCLHNEEDQLMRVTESQNLDDYSTACARCSDSSNYQVEDTDTGSGESTCICTPECGSCDPNPRLSDEESGYMCINLSAYIAAEEGTSGSKAKAATLIPGTGGMKQAKPYGGSAECSFGRTYRTHKRGTKYDASVSTIPTDSIVIIDMEKMKKKCTVDLPGTPGRILYAPNGPVDLTKSGLSTTASSANSAAGFTIHSIIMALSVTIFVGTMGITMI